MAGILSAIKLREAGLDDFTVYEKADRLGGTWRENTYPGVACDVPSHLYSYSFAPNPEWSHRFSPGRGDPARTSRASPASTASTAAIRFGDEVDARRASTTAAGSSRRARRARRRRRRDRRDRRAAPSEAPRHRRARSLRGRAASTARAGITTSRSTAAASASSARARPRCRSSRRSSTASRSSRSSSARRSGSCRRRTPPTPRPSARRSGANPTLLRRSSRELVAQLFADALLQRRRRRRLAADAGDRGRCAETNLETERRRPGAARAAPPELPRRLQAPGRSRPTSTRRSSSRTPSS